MLKTRTWFLGLASAATTIGLVSTITLHATPSRAAGDDAAAGAPLASNRFDAEAYQVEMKGTGPYRIGVEGRAQLTLNSKPGYHVNDKYPIKLKLSDPAPEGVTYPKAILKRGDASCAEASCTFEVPFLPARAGKARVAGVFAFSVCSESSCIMEKLELELSVDVQ